MGDVSMNYDPGKVKDEEALPYSTVQIFVQGFLIIKCDTRLLHATEQRARRVGMMGNGEPYSFARLERRHQSI